MCNEKQWQKRSADVADLGGASRTGDYICMPLDREDIANLVPAGVRAVTPWHWDKSGRQCTPQLSTATWKCRPIQPSDVSHPSASSCRLTRNPDMAASRLSSMHRSVPHIPTPAHRLRLRLRIQPTAYSGGQIPPRSDPLPSAMAQAAMLGPSRRVNAGCMAVGKCTSAVWVRDRSTGSIAAQVRLP